MKSKKLKQKINIINSKNIYKGFNDINPKKEKYNQDLIFTEANFNFHNDKIFPIYNNTISYSNTEKNLKIGDEQNEKKDLNNLNNKNIKNNIELLSQDKFIQTPSNFYSLDQLKKIEYKSFTPNRKTMKKEKEYKSHLGYKNFENNKYIPRINSGLKSTYISKSFYKKNQKIKNIKHSRNQLYPLIDNDKEKTNIKYFKNFNILKDYFNNNTITEVKKKHHNLLTIENIYFQRKTPNNIYNLNGHIEKDYNNSKKKVQLSSLLQKKYSIKEIKYPLFDSVIKKYKIINDNNDHLLEKIFKKQTLSNFNNKYTLKYKTNNTVRKENIKNLFSSLKKYKYSDEDIKNAFNKYNSMKRIKKIFNA